MKREHLLGELRNKLWKANVEVIDNEQTFDEAKVSQSKKKKKSDNKQGSKYEAKQQCTI